MTDLGIPIPPPQSPYYCVNCGEHHRPNPATLPAAAVELAELRARLARLESQFFDMATNAEGRLLALEAKRKK